MSTCLLGLQVVLQSRVHVVDFGSAHGFTFFFSFSRLCNEKSCCGYRLVKSLVVLLNAETVALAFSLLLYHLWL